MEIQRWGLLANAVGQSIHPWLNDRHRGQARLPHLNGGGRRILVRHRSVWELACLRWRWVSQLICCGYTTIAGKSGSHIWTVADAEFWSDTDQCGSWLACDGGESVSLSAADTPLSRASPAPTF